MKRLKVGLLFFETLQDGVDVLKSFVDLFADFGPRQDDFSRDKYEQDDSGFDHPVDEAGEEFGLVAAELSVGQH